MAEIVWPTANDVATVSGEGSKMVEQNAASWFDSLIGQDFVISGFTLPASDADLVVPCAAGFAVIDGRWISIDASTNLTVFDGGISYIFLKLTYDGGGNVATVEFEVNNTSSQPANSVAIGTTTAASGSVSSTTDTRIVTPTRGKFWDNVLVQENMADDCIGQGQIITSTVNLAGVISADSYVQITLSPYSFFPMVHYLADGTSPPSPIAGGFMHGSPTDGADPDSPGFIISSPSVSGTYDVDYRYITT